MLLDLFSKIYSVAMSRRSHCMASSSCLFINSFARSLCASLSSEIGQVSSTVLKIQLAIHKRCIFYRTLLNELIKFFCERLLYLITSVIINIQIRLFTTCIQFVCNPVSILHLQLRKRRETISYLDFGAIADD